MVTVRDGTLRGGLPYLAVGDGPPLLLFPGLSGENANPTGLDRTMQVGSLRPLAGHFTVHLVSRRPGLPPGASIRDLADDYADAIAGTIPAPTPLLGISTGGSIAQQFAVDHGGLVSRLVLVSSACRLSPAGRRVQNELVARIAAGQSRRGWAAVGTAMAATRPGGAAMAATMWLAGAALTPDDTSDLVTTVAAEDRFDITRDLPRIGPPTLVIGGERDHLYSPELFRTTADGIPDCRLLLFRGKGHAVTSASRATARQALRFLTR